jgi:hypothetical protein
MRAEERKKRTACVSAACGQILRGRRANSVKIACRFEKPYIRTAIDRIAAAAAVVADSGVRLEHVSPIVFARVHL